MADHDSRGVGSKPGRQKSLSNSTTGSLVIAPNARASVDFPDAPRPRMTTRCMLQGCSGAIGDSSIVSLGVAPNRLSRHRDRLELQVQCSALLKSRGRFIELVFC